MSNIPKKSSGLRHLAVMYAVYRLREGATSAQILAEMPELGPLDMQSAKRVNAATDNQPDGFKSEDADAIKEQGGSA